MYQAGIKKIVLYENKNISYVYYDGFDLTQITDILTEGNIIEVENYQKPMYDIQYNGNAGRLTGEVKMDFLLFGLLADNLNVIGTIKDTIYGWTMLVEFYDKTYKYYNNVIFFDKADIKPQEAMVYKVELESLTPSIVEHLNFTADVFLPTYRADTNILSADTEVYSADYSM